MNALPPLDIAALLREFGLHPKKSLGQNFLADPAALGRVVQAAAITPADTVLEVGPGLGSLTRYLASQARKVVAVELDGHMQAPFRRVMASFSNVDLVGGDILALSPAALGLEPGYLVVANIPYYLTSALLRHLLEADPRPSRLVLTIQKEVAARVCAGPGEMSLLALSVQVYGFPRQLATIPASAFHPPPKVDSAVLRIDLYEQPRIAPPLLEAFFKLAKAGFSQKRKNLRNSISGGMHWPKEQAEAFLQAAGIDPRRRAETLSLEEWNTLAQALEAASTQNRDQEPPQ